MRSCPYCLAQNLQKASRCHACGNTIELSLEAINDLRRELGNFQEEISGKWNHFEARLEALAELAQAAPAPEVPEIQAPPLAQIPLPEVPIPVFLIPDPELLSNPPEPLPNYSEPFPNPPEPLPNPPRPRRSIRIPSLVTEMFLAPVAQIKDYAVEVFLHYKAQNKLPVFFMTLAGIVAMLFGFGYLMQFATSPVYKVLKVGASFGAVAWIVLWGAGLVRKHEKYREFGSALMGLGISLNYLILYFLSDPVEFPVLATRGISLLLILANSVLAAWLALRYETKIVAVLSLLGGAFAPFYLHTEMISGFYFAYLWLLCASSIYVAHRIGWKPLAQLAFYVAVLVTEWVVFVEPGAISVPVFAVLLHAFTALFLYYALFERGNPKFMLAREDIFMMVATLSLFLLNLFLLFDGHNASRSLGLVYLADGAVFIAGFFLLRSRLHPHMQALAFGLAATFAGFAVPALLGQHLMGAFWAVEGMALVFCGFTFALPSVRKEGYVLLLLALARMAWTFQDIAESWGETLWTGGYWNLLLLGLLAYGLKALLDKHARANHDFERRISYGLFEGLSFWATAALLVAGFFYLGEFAINLSPILLLALVYWGYQNGLRLTERLGMWMYGLLIWGYMRSTGEVDSFRFTDQTLPGKLALIEAFGLMWLLQAYYEWLMPKNPRLLLVSFMREVFYILLPVAWLPSVARHFPEYLPLALVISAGMSFLMSGVLGEKLKLVGPPILRKQGHLLPVFLLVTAFPAALAVWEGWENGLWTPHFAHLLLLGPAAWLLRRFLMRHRTRAGVGEKKRLSYALFEFFSCWAGAILLVLGAYYLGWWVLTLVPLLTLALVGWGSKNALLLTERFGLWHYFLLLIGIGFSMFFSGSGYFSDQLLWGKILMVEALVMLGLLQTYYEKALPGNPRLAAMKQLRVIFFLLLPLVWLPSVWQHANLWFAAAAWGAVAMGFVLAEATGLRTLRVELRFLTLFATLAALAQPGYLSVGLGLAVLFGILLFKGGLFPAACRRSPYRDLFNYAFYYLGLSLFLLVIRLNDFDTLVSALALPAFYFGGIAFFHARIPAIRRSYRFAYRLGFLLMMGSLFVFLLDTTEGINLYETRFEWVNILFLVAMMGIFHLNLYKRGCMYPRCPEAFVWRFDQVMLHLCNIMAYMGILSFFTHDWSGLGLTIALIVHGIILLFNSAQPRFAFLMRFALAVIAGAFAKLFFFDFVHFIPVHKVIVCMVVGLLLLVGSRLFLKYRDHIAVR